MEGKIEGKASQGRPRGINIWGKSRRIQGRRAIGK
jgi:hypothetical protein